MKLPRGIEGAHSIAPTATARWSTPDEVLRYRYKQGDIYLGDIRIAPENAKAVIAALDTFLEEVSGNAALDDRWRQAQIDKASAYRDQLCTLEHLGCRGNRGVLVVEAALPPICRRLEVLHVSIDIVLGVRVVEATLVESVAQARPEAVRLSLDP